MNIRAHSKILRTRSWKCLKSQVNLRRSHKQNKYAPFSSMLLISFARSSFVTNLFCAVTTLERTRSGSRRARFSHEPKPNKTNKLRRCSIPGAVAVRSNNILRLSKNYGHNSALKSRQFKSWRVKYEVRRHKLQKRDE